MPHTFEGKGSNMPSFYEVGDRVSFVNQLFETVDGTVEKKEYSWKFGWLYLIKVDEITSFANVNERDIWGTVK